MTRSVNALGVVVLVIAAAGCATAGSGEPSDAAIESPIDARGDGAALPIDAPPTPTFALTTVISGNGSILSSPPGIGCGSDCTESYPAGTVVTLTATPAVGAAFTSWSGGGCSGTGPCVVTITAATTITATFAVGVCDGFATANSTTIPGWTERAGDWFIDGQRLRNSTTASFYANVATMDGSTQTNGCARLSAAQTPPGSTQSVGAVLRWTPAGYVVALVQDNTNAGVFNTLYIYEFPSAAALLSMSGQAFGTTPNLEACVNGATVTVRVDADQNGVYETTGTGTTTIAGAGLTGVMTHTFTHHPFVDNFCWSP